MFSWLNIEYIESELRKSTNYNNDDNDNGKYY